MKPNLYSLRDVFFASIFLFSLIACTKEKSSQELSPQEEEMTVQAGSESEAEAEVTGNDVFDDAIGANNEVGMSGADLFGGRLSGSAGVDSIPHCARITITRLNAPEPFPLRIVTDLELQDVKAGMVKPVMERLLRFTQAG